MLVSFVLFLSKCKLYFLRLLVKNDSILCFFPLVGVWFFVWFLFSHTLLGSKYEIKRTKCKDGS